MIYKICNNRYSCRRNLTRFRTKTKLVLRCLLIIIIMCTAMNTAALASIGYHVSVRQKTLVDVFNTSMRLYVSVKSYKYAIDQIQFVLQCCGHTSYTDWFLFDWQVSFSYIPLCFDCEFIEVIEDLRNDDK